MRKRILVGVLVASTNKKQYDKCKSNIVIVRYSGKKRLKNIEIPKIIKNPNLLSSGFYYLYMDTYQNIMIYIK